METPTKEIILDDYHNQLYEAFKPLIELAIEAGVKAEREKWIEKIQEQKADIEKYPAKSTEAKIAQWAMLAMIETLLTDHKP